MNKQPTTTKEKLGENTTAIRVLIAMIAVGATVCIAFMGAVSSKYSAVKENDIKQDVKMREIETSYEFIREDLCEIKASVKEINRKIDK